MTQDPRDRSGGAADGTPPADPVLRRMLDAAPDRDAAPRPATREAILRTAHNAVATSAPARPEPRDAALPWWKRLWGATPGLRMPWNAAFATVLVAMFVTVLWHREPVPDARVEAEAPAAPAARPSATPESSPAPAATEVAPSTPVPASPPSPALRERERADTRTAREQRRPAPEADAAARSQSTPDAKARTEPQADRPPPVAAPSASTAVPPPAPEANFAPAPPPSPAGAPAAAGVPPAAAARAVVPSPAPPPPPAELAPAPMREAAPPPAALARRPLAPAAHPGAWREWTHLRIVDASGQSRRLARAEAAQLGALVEAALPSESGAAAAEAPAPGWRIVLEGARGAALGVLEVPAAPGRTLRWREGTATPVDVEPPPAVVEALQRALAQR
jgi:hypothetical protein